MFVFLSGAGTELTLSADIQAVTASLDTHVFAASRSEAASCITTLSTKS